jgi:hypothetical protein
MIGLRKIAIYIGVLIFHSACSTSTQHSLSTPSQTSLATRAAPSPPSTTTNLAAPSCTRVVGHENSDGQYIPTYYRCKGLSTGSTAYSSSACSWVNSYTRKDGTMVEGHTRCISNPSVTQSSSSTPASSNLRPSGSNCHYVGGYRRKNGSYVKGHMRCR